MDGERLGSIVGASLASGVPLTAEAVAGVLTDEERLDGVSDEAFLRAAEKRGFTLVVASGALAVKGAGQAGETIEKIPGTEAAPEVIVPEIDEATKARLEALPASLGELVASRYMQKYVAVTRYIEQGKLPEDYRLPELSTFMDMVEAVAPTFEHLAITEAEPSVEFVPQKLSDGQWNSLFSGHSATRNGTYRTFSGQLIDPTKPKPEEAGAETTGSLWDVVVIDSAKRPTFTNVSKDGTRGTNKKIATAALQQLPNANADQSAKEAIAGASPTESTYRGLQLGRVERGEQPVDPLTWTLARENTKVGRRLRAVYLSFDPSIAEVGSNWGRLDIADDSDGIRVSASGQEILAFSSGS